MKNILVTGSVGFIGFHLCLKLLNKGFNVLGIDNHNSYYDLKLKHNRYKILNKFSNYQHKKVDLTKFSKLKNVVTSFKPQIIVNLAAQAGVRYSFTNPSAYIDSNLIGFHNILKLAKDLEVNKFIYASSSSVYGEQKKFPLNENFNTDSPSSLYAATKKSNELMAYSYSNIHNLNTTGLRFFTVYGPWGRPDMSLFKFTKLILEKKYIEVYNSGHHVRDFTYIDDITNGISNIILVSLNLIKISNSNLKSIFTLYNLGNGNPVRLIKFIRIIEKELAIKAKIKYLDKQLGDVKTHANIDLAKKDFNYNPITTISDGIPKFIQWYKNYYEIF